MNNRNKKKKKYCLLALVLMAFLMVCAPAMGKNGEKLAGVRTVEAASKYVTARFWDASGETSYGKLRIKVKKVIKLHFPKFQRYLATWGWDGPPRKMLQRRPILQERKFD